MKSVLQFVLGGIFVAGLSACNKDNFINGVPDEPTPAKDKLTVYEYTPGPGQFINDKMSATTAEQAALWAQHRLEEGEIVSLGSFGGYIVLGLGHPVADFEIKGNAFANAGGASNEPGIVYVMPDQNGNGLPDDRWYELQGSETGTELYESDYAVTYYRPMSPESPVRWVDCRGEEGVIDYLPMFHSQPSYYPEWIDKDSYTLTGTKVVNEVEVSNVGQWFIRPLQYGYADNCGSNNDEFHVADAIMPDGTPANLKTADFIKVQTGVIGKAGYLGELSTEIMSIREL